MERKRLDIGPMPALLWGPPGEGLWLYVHGQCGCKEEAADFAEIAVSAGWQVLSVDLPGHGERQSEELVPWRAVPELRQALAWARGRCSRLALRANSIAPGSACWAFPGSLWSAVSLCLRFWIWNVSSGI